MDKNISPKLLKELYSSEIGICYKINLIQQDRETIVFIHGLTGSISAWTEYEKVFCERYNLVLIDLRGHGKSHKFSAYSDYEISKLATDVHRLLTLLAISKCILISHSFGTLVALEFLQLYSRMVSSVIYLSPNFNVQATIEARITNHFITASIPLLELLPLPMPTGRHVDYARFPDVGDWDVFLNYADIRNTSVRVYVFCLGHIYTHNYNEIWGSINLPTLIIHGEKDSIIPINNALMLAKKIKYSKLIIIPRANHLLITNDAPHVAATIQNFLLNS